MNTIYSLIQPNHFRAVADVFVLWGLFSATEQLRGELHKSEVVKAQKYITEYNQNPQNNGNSA